MREESKRVSYRVHEYVSDLTDKEELTLFRHLLDEKKIDSVSACSAVLPGLLNFLEIFF